LPPFALRAHRGNAEPTSIDDEISALMGNQWAAVPSSVLIRRSLTGPHDVSRYFGYEAQGFHLKEYTNREMRRLLLDAGFSRATCCVIVKGRKLPLPMWIAALLESCFSLLPQSRRAALSRSAIVNVLLGVNAIGYR